MTLFTITDSVLAVAVFLSTLLTGFIVTLPTAYNHLDHDSLDQDTFTEDDRQNASRSGFAYHERNKNAAGKLIIRSTVQVVVLGDIGRSPRMQYHALSLAQHGAHVQLIGYADSQPHPDVVASKLINIVEIPTTPATLQTSSKVLFVLLAPLKVIYQSLALYRALAYRTTASRFMLVQNPPSIPVLAIAVFVCFFRNTRLVIDWHNFGYSILALRLGSRHPLVLLSRWYEGFVSRGADAHFTVTDAMKRKVSLDFGIDALTLHDRPADLFQPLEEQQRLQFLQSCDTTAPYAKAIKNRACRVLVSSTSWTADEDFGVLLRALVSYSAASLNDKRQPNLLVIITGKGPQQKHYQDQITSLEQSGSLQNVTIKTVWLSINDYATLLATADLGVCLHTSSSGVDLPMKVLDMFGAGLPVVGWSKYESWPELVHEGVNGLGFGNSSELAAILESLFLSGNSQLQQLKRGAIKEGDYRWNDEWKKCATLFRVDTTS